MLYSIKAMYKRECNSAQMMSKTLLPKYHMHIKFSLIIMHTFNVFFGHFNQVYARTSQKTH